MFADRGLVTLRQRFDGVVYARRFAGDDHVFEGRVRITEYDVVVDRTGEQDAVLRHHAEAAAQFVGAEMADVVAVELDAAFSGLIEALQQLGQRALAATRRPHDGDALAGLYPDIQVLIQVRQVLAVAEGEVLDFDPALSRAFPARHHGVGLLRCVHHVTQALDRDAGLLKFLPQADELQHRLRQAAGEHLEGNQHANGEAHLLHDHPRTGAQDREGKQLVQHVGRDLIAVGERAGLEARFQVRSQVIAETRIQLRLHLQRFHRFQAGDVLGQESLVARAQQELLVQAPAEQGGDHQAQDDDGSEDAESDE